MDMGQRNSSNRSRGLASVGTVSQRASARAQWKILCRLVATACFFINQSVALKWCASPVELKFLLLAMWAAFCCVAKPKAMPLADVSAAMGRRQWLDDSANGSSDVDDGTAAPAIQLQVMVCVCLCVLIFYFFCYMCYCASCCHFIFSIHFFKSFFLVKHIIRIFVFIFGIIKSSWAVPLKLQHTSNALYVYKLRLRQARKTFARPLNCKAQLRRQGLCNCCYCAAVKNVQ